MNFKVEVPCFIFRFFVNGCLGTMLNVLFRSNRYGRVKDYYFCFFREATSQVFCMGAMVIYANDSIPFCTRKTIYITYFLGDSSVKGVSIHEN